MKVGIATLCAAMVLLCGCAPVAREPDDLALVQVLGVDGGGQVTLTAVCGSDGQKPASRGAATAADFETARKQLPWSGAGQELSLTGVSYILVGAGVELESLLHSVLEDVDLGASATVWLAEDGAAALLAACDDPAADLELLSLQKTAAPTVAQAMAALTTTGTVTLPCLGQENGRIEKRGTNVWSAPN